MDNLTPITREEMLMNDEPLTPITREEKILAGEDLTPVTRREYFLKKYRHAGGEVMVEGLEVTANGTYTAPEGKAYSPVEVAVPLPDNAYLLKEASGSLVSFTDGADLPMPSFICNIDAVQDLHGYDSPWVGGAGKNKSDNKDATTNSNGTVNLITNGTYGDVVAGTTYTFSFDVLETNAQAVQVRLNNANNSITGGSYTAGTLVQGTRTTLVFTPSESGSLNFWANTNAFTANKKVIDNVQLEVGNQATAYQPYSNICPISGHTGVDAVISPTTEASAGTTIAVSWQTEAGEVYGGYVDLVSGELTVTDGYIASYNGETLPSTWISDRDVYTEGTSPTTGAEVVYKLANPQTYQLTPTQIKSLLGYNNAWCSTGNVDIDYFAKEV